MKNFNKLVAAAMVCGGLLGTPITTYAKDTNSVQKTEETSSKKGDKYSKLEKTFKKVYQKNLDDAQVTVELVKIVDESSTGYLVHIKTTSISGDEFENVQVWVNKEKFTEYAKGNDNSEKA